MILGCMPMGSCSPKGYSRDLLETLFSEPLLRTLLRTLFYCKTHNRPPSQNPSQNPSPKPFPEPFLECCVAVRPLRRAPKIRFPPLFVHALPYSLEETGTDQTNPTCQGFQNCFWRGHSMVRFPPINRTMRFPPPFAISQVVKRAALLIRILGLELCLRGRTSPRSPLVSALTFPGHLWGAGVGIRFLRWLLSRGR